MAVVAKVIDIPSSPPDIDKVSTPVRCGGMVSFRATVSVVASIFVAITGLGPWYLADRLNNTAVTDLANQLQNQVILTVSGEVLGVTDSVRQLATRGALGAFGDEGAEFGCCSEADDDAQRLARFEKVRRYHWENLETNERVLLSYTGTMAGSILLLARTSHMVDIDGTGARNGEGNLQWTLSDATTQYRYHQYYSNTWMDSGYTEVDTSMCGQSYVSGTIIDVSVDLTSKAECEAAAIAMGIAVTPTAIDNSTMPRGCFRDTGDSGVYWNPSGDASLQEVDKKALCSVPAWFQWNQTFEPDCNHSWPCTTGEFVATNNPHFSKDLYKPKTSLYNATVRSWWKGAVANGKTSEGRVAAGWSKVYLSKSTGQLVLPAVMPLYIGTTDTVRAVITVGIGLLYLDGFIEEVVKRIDANAKGWIMDASTGKLIASSPMGLSTSNSTKLVLALKAGEISDSGKLVQGVSEQLWREVQLGSWMDFKSAHPSGYSFEYDNGDEIDLIQVTSLSDGHGLEWIIVLAVPRSVFYSGLDKAREYTIIGTVALTVAMAAILLAISWSVSSRIKKLGVKMEKVSRMEWGSGSTASSLYSEIGSMENSFKEMSDKLKNFWELEQEQARRSLQEKRQRENTRIRAAIKDGEELRHPMVLIKATTFIELGQLMRYEDLRDAGKLRVLDTMAKVEEFEKKHSIVFFSHQWLDWGCPDPENVHHKCMTNAILQLQKTMSSKGTGTSVLDEMYVWVDYSSISQEHRGMQILAISALPVYSSKAEAFVIIAPQATHATSCVKCNLNTYDTRGWCRVETLAKVCGSGISKMYLMTGVDCELQQITTQTFKENLSLRVFEAEFSCCALGHKGQPYCDKENLVESVLGLYHRLLVNSEKFDQSVVLEHINESKERFFPPRFKFSRANLGEDEDRELFGELVQLLEATVQGERRIDTNSKATCISPCNPASSQHLARAPQVDV